MPLPIPSDMNHGSRGGRRGLRSHGFRGPEDYGPIELIIPEAIRENHMHGQREVGMLADQLPSDAPPAQSDYHSADEHSVDEHASWHPLPPPRSASHMHHSGQHGPVVTGADVALSFLPPAKPEPAIRMRRHASRPVSHEGLEPSWTSNPLASIASPDSHERGAGERF